MSDTRKRAHAGLVVLIAVVWASAAHAATLKEMRVEMDGDTRGVAVSGYHVYVASGPAGLRIFNFSNPSGVMHIGRATILDGWVDRVAVDRRTAVLTDSRNRLVHFVDAADVSRPRLRQSLRARAVPHRVDATGGRAYVVERSTDPLDLRSFSGIEVFSFSGESVGSLQTEAIAQVRDAAVHRGYLLIAAANTLGAYRLTRAGFEHLPAAIVELGRSDEIQSIAAVDGYIFVFGSAELSVVGFMPVPILLPTPAPGKLPGRVPRRPSLKLSVLDSQPLDCHPENREVDARILDYGGGATSDPNLAVLLTTRHSYGLFAFNKATQQLSPIDVPAVPDLPAHVFYDLYEATEGQLEIYDAAFPEHFYPGWLRGGVMGIGALGTSGFGFAYLVQ